MYGWSEKEGWLAVLFQRINLLAVIHREINVGFNCFLNLFKENPFAVRPQCPSMQRYTVPPVPASLRTHVA